MKSLLMFFLILCLPFQLLAGNYQVYSAGSGEMISFDQLIEELPINQTIVLGEYHYDPAILQGHADIIDSFVKYNQLQGEFTLGWEFLNVTDQETVDEAAVLFKRGELDREKYLKMIFPNTSRWQINLPYMAMMEVTMILGGELIGLNAPRSVKRVIRKEGLGAIDPELVPPNMELGSEFYLERFVAAMGGHVPKEELEAYFLVQSYVDSLMSYTIDARSSHLSRFLVAGAFHTDFFDGTVAGLMKLNPGQVVSIKIVNIDEMSQDEVQELKSSHERYGHYADYIVFSSSK